MPDAEMRLSEAVSLVQAAQDAGATLRLLGGIAAALHSGSLTSGRPHREFGDIDSITRRRDVGAVVRALRNHGFEPDGRFNALNAGHRLIFYGPPGKLDVFVNNFEMCHRLELSERLLLDSPTLTVSDLLLTKLQVVELTEKDVADLELLLKAHEVGESEGDVINAPYIARLLARNWGLWRTVTRNLERLAGLDSVVDARGERLLNVIAAAPRTSGFRLRAVLGERKRWYELPEEVG